MATQVYIHLRYSFAVLRNSLYAVCPRGKQSSRCESRVSGIDLAHSPPPGHISSFLDRASEDFLSPWTSFERNSMFDGDCWVTCG